MAFSYDGKNLPSFVHQAHRSLTSYADAVQFWETAYRWQGEPNERVLDSTRKRYVTIRKLDDGSIACKLHHTDVVTFRPDNKVKIVPYPSVSTDTFFWGLGVHTDLSARFNIGVIQVKDKVYRTVCSNMLILSLDTLEWDTPPEPFKIMTINRKRANEVRKQYDYASFATWVKMIAQMGDWPDMTAQYFPSYRNPKVYLDRNNWPALLVAQYQGTNVAATLARARNTIYQAHPEVYDVEVRPYLDSWSEVERWRRW